MTSWQRFRAALGPGIVWAGTAIGVSHLVQSTRAGAGYGLTLVWLVVVVHLLKYPAFEAGPRYVAGTGRSLLEGYRRQGRWALVLFALQSLLTMSIVEAAVTIVTAGMASALVTDAVPVTWWSAGLLLASGSVLLVGRFSALDKLMKAMVGLLALSTVAAVALLLPSTDPSRLPLWPPLPAPEPAHIAFLVAFVGWMPAPFDTAVWQAQWRVERDHAVGPSDWGDARRDFLVGYVGTAVLAVGFVVLGAAVLHGTDRTIPSAAPAFAALLVDLYTVALGPWARPFLLVAAFVTMLSTTLAVTDGFPRAVAGVVARWTTPEAPDRPHDPRVYAVAVVLLVASAQVLIAWFAKDLTGLIDLATTLSFVLTPVLAVLNLRAVRSADMPAGLQPRGLLLGAHAVGILAMIGFSVAWGIWRFGG